MVVADTKRISLSFRCSEFRGTIRADPSKADRNYGDPIAAQKWNTGRTRAGSEDHREFEHP